MPSIVQYIRRANVGRKILRDWRIGGSVPVPIEQAQARANVCLHGGSNGARCPYNEPDDNWIWDNAKAIIISRRLDLRRIHNIHLEGEENLNTCAACGGCVLKIKVHTPLKHVLRHTIESDQSKFPDFCWIRTEQSTSQPK